MQAGREREFANIYRGSDAARRLTDEDFGAVLAFTKAAFEMALAFRGGKPAPARAGSQKRLGRRGEVTRCRTRAASSASVRVTTSVTSGDRPGASAIR